MGNKNVPPRLKFEGIRPSEEDRVQLIESLAEKRRVPNKNQAILLFLFYTELDNGFRPSESYIETALRMSECSFRRARKNLNEYGLIFWDKVANTITIDFETLFILDSIPAAEACLYSAKNKVNYTNDNTHERERTIGERNMFVPGYFDMKNLDEDEKDIFKAINELTPRELCSFWGLEYRPEIEEAPEVSGGETCQCPSNIDEIVRNSMAQMGYREMLRGREIGKSLRFVELARSDTDLNRFVIGGWVEKGEFGSYEVDLDKDEFIVTSPVKAWGTQRFDSDGKFLGDREDSAVKEWISKPVVEPETNPEAVEEQDWISEIAPIRQNPNCDMRKYIEECRRRRKYVFDPGYSYDTNGYRFFFDGKWTCFDKKGMYISDT